MKLLIYTNLSDKFKMPLLKEMAKEPLIVDNVTSFKVLTDEEIMKQEDRKKYYQLRNQDKRKQARERKVYYHLCSKTTNNSMILLSEDYICKRCNEFVPEQDRIDSKKLDEEYKNSHSFHKRFQKFKREIDSEPVNAKVISNELIKLDTVDNRVTCYSPSGKIRCCHNKNDECSCKCHNTDTQESQS